MSEVLATLGDATSVASGLATLAFGAAGPVVLGAFAFQDFEVPETVQLPVRQAVEIHRLIGGERVLDAMGPDYGDIAWEGVMLGAGCETRAQELKALVDAAQAVTLTWGSWSFTVLARALLLREGYQRIGYALRCAIIRDDSTVPTDTMTSLGMSLIQDMDAAVGGGGGALSSVLATAQTALQSLQPIQPGSTKVASALAVVSATQQVTQTSAAGSSAQLGVIGGRAARLSTPVASMADISGAVTQTGQLAQASIAYAYLGRMAANLTANL